MGGIVIFIILMVIICMYIATYVINKNTERPETDLDFSSCKCCGDAGCNNNPAHRRPKEVK